MSSIVSNEHIGLDLDFLSETLPKTGEAGDSSVRLVQSQHSQNTDDLNKDFENELTLRHIQGEKVFWESGYELKSQVTFKGNYTSFPLSIETIVCKYLAKGYFHKEESSGEIALIRENFKPISLGDSFSSLFQDGEAKTTIFIRSPDPPNKDLINNNNITSGGSNMISNNSYSEGSKMLQPEVKTNLTLVEETNDLVVIIVEEVSGRKIIWDEKNKVFGSIVQIQLPRAHLSELRVDAVLSRIMPKTYLEPSSNVIEKHIWTDKIKVVGLNDTLDVVCPSTSKVHLYLKYIRSSEEQQWQEILDAISQFKEKVSYTDDELKAFYEDNGVFQDMDELKSKIQSDNRNEEEIQAMMLKLEPKLNRALSFISTIEESEVDGVVDGATKSAEAIFALKPILSHCSNVCRYEASRVNYQFYHW